MPDPDDPRFAQADGQSGIAQPQTDPAAPMPAQDELVRGPQDAALVHPAFDARGITPPKVDPLTPPEPHTPADDAADQVVGRKKALLAYSLRLASQQSPDAAAKARTVADQTGLPEGMAARNPAQADGVAKAQRAPDILVKHPELAKWLTTPKNAVVAHDDLDNLTNLDHVVQSVGQDVTGILAPGYLFRRDGVILQMIPQDKQGGMQSQEIGTIEDYQRHLRRLGEDQLADDVNNAMAAQRYGNPLGLGRVGRLAETFLGGIQQGRGTTTSDSSNAQEALANAFPEEAGSLTTGLSQFAGNLVGQGPELMVGKSFGSMAEAITNVARVQRATSAAVGARVAAWGGKRLENVAVMAPMNSGHAIEVGKEQGVMAGLADFIASSGIMAVTGPVGIARALVTPVERAAVVRGWTPALQGILRDAGLMGGQNAALALSQALERRVFGDGKEIDADELTQQMLQSGEVGAVAGAAFGLGPEVGAKFHRDATAAMGSLEVGDRLMMAIKQVQASKLQARSPEAMKSALDAMLGDGQQDRHVYFQSKDWREHWQAQGQDPIGMAAKHGVDLQLMEAQATGGDMAMPLPAYLQAMAESKTPDKLVAKTKSSPGAMTPEEGVAFHDQTPDAVQKLYQMAAKSGADASAEASGSASFQKIHDEAMADIQRLRPHWSAAQADAIAQIHARVLSGIARQVSPEGAPVDPLELHNRVTYGSELPESLRGKGYDAINTLMEKIHTGEGAQNQETEQAMADLAAHAEAVGAGIDEHVLSNIKGIMDAEGGKALGMTVENRLDQALQAPRNDSLDFHDLVRQWKKAHGEDLKRGDPGWAQLVAEAERVDLANGKTYEQPARGGYTPGPDGKSKITLGPDADASTVIHELGHYALDTLTDYAGREGAPAQLKRDLQALMDHMGVKDLETWQGMDFESRRPGHERFAESFESYFMEGKAPAQELRGIFRRIRNLMAAIYRTLKPLVTLSPEVRNVFDRLLASDAEIERAREDMTAKPVFRSADEAGMKPDEFAAYLKDSAAELEQDRARLQDKTMEDVARRLTDNWKDEETRVRGDMTSLVDARPEYHAMQLLHAGEWPEGTKPEGAGPLKLDRKAIVDVYGEDGLKDLPGRTGFSNNPNRGAPLYANEGGVQLDVAAALFGYRSGDELYKALVSAKSRTMAIDKMTAGEMEKRHPNTNLEDEAQDILHGAASGKRILRELDSLGKAVGEAPPPVEVLRQVAERTIAARDVRSINPEIYRRAEAKAGREVLEAVAKGDKRAAYEAQVKRVLNSEMFKAASEAKAQINDDIDYAKRFGIARVREQLGKAGGWEWQVFGADGKPLTKPDGSPATFSTDAEAKRFSTMNGDAPYLRTSSYLGQIDALRERFGFTRSQMPGQRETLTSWIKDEQQRGSEVIIPDWIANTGDAMSWRDLSFEKFTDVADAMRNIAHLGQERNRLGADMDRKMLGGVVQQLTDTSNANKQRIRKRGSAPGVIDRIYNVAASSDAWLTRLSTQAHIMDGFKEGGTWWETLVRPLQEAANREAKLQSADAEGLHALMKEAGYLDQTGRIWKREYSKEIDDHMSHITRLMVALNYGRQVGRERLLTAHWTQDQIQRLVLDRLDAKDRDFLHGVWNLFEKKYPDLRAQAQRLTGVTPGKSEALPFTNAAGLVFKGGYLPIKYDPRANPKSAALAEAANLTEAKRGVFSRAKTRDSMLKATQETTGMKLRLDEGVIFEGLRESNHRLAQQDAITDITKILTHKGMADTITKNHGIDAYNLIRDAVADVAKGTSEDLGGMGKVWRHLRTGVPAAAFGYNFMRAFLDAAESLPQSVIRVGAPRLLVATGKMLASTARFESFAKQIASKSEVMADRQRVSLRSANDAFKGARLAGSFREHMDHMAQAVMHRAHLFTDHIVWQAAYDKALAEFKGDDTKAVAVADSITQDTQSSGRTMDLAKFQRGGEFQKMLTVAYGFFGSAYQIQKVAGLRGLAAFRAGDVAGVGRMFADYVCIYSLPIAIDMALKGALRGNPDEKPREGKDVALDYALEHLAFAFGTIPIAREISGAVATTMGYGGPAGERGISALYSLVQHSAIAARHAVQDKELTEKQVKAQEHALLRDVMQAGGIIFHLPSTQVQRTIDGVAYAMEHNKNPILPAVVGKPLKH